MATSTITTVITKFESYESCMERIFSGMMLTLLMPALILKSLHVCRADNLGNIDLANVNPHIGGDVLLASPTIYTNLNSSSNDFNITALLKRVASACEKHCQDETNYFIDGKDLNCLASTNNSFCVENRCLNGCRQWWRALQEYVPCTEACVSAEIQPHDMICITACKIAQYNYWYLLQLSLQAIVKQVEPEAFYETNNMQIIHMKWRINLPTPNLFGSPSYVQYQVVGDSKWNRLHVANCTQTYHCLLDAAPLLTHNALRFRYALHMGATSSHSIYSPASNILIIVIGGPPTTAPEIRDYLEMDSTHFACVWQGSVGLTGYRLSLQAAKSYVLKEEILAADAKYYILDNLSPETNYILKLAKLNEFGEGPATELIISPALRKFNHTNDFVGDLSAVLLIGEFSIKLKTLKPVLHTKPVFESDELISDYDVQLSSQLLYVITADGNVYRQRLHDMEGKELLKFNDDITVIKAQPQKITVDWINYRLFMACRVSAKEWIIISTDLDLNEFKVLTRNLTHQIEQLKVDPINGWLFWRDENNLCRFNLALNIMESLTPNKELGFIFDDYARYLLLVYNKSDSTFWEQSYDGMYVRPLLLQQQNFSSVLSGEIYSFFYSDIPRLLAATNGTHLHIENEATSDYDLFDLSRDVEWCTSIQLMSSAYSQPIPAVSHESPQNLQALFSYNMANISWVAPPINYFQTQAAFHHWEYELEIMDVASNIAFTIRNVRTTFFNVEKLQANNVYSLRVRTMGVHSAGPWSQPMTSRTWPQSVHKFLWATRAGLYQTNELGLEIQALIPNTNGNSLRDFVQCNSTIYYISGTHHLMCANIINPEFNCSSFSFTKALSLAYDWRGAKLYWSDIQRDCLIRSNLDGSERELLPILGARHIQLDVYSGHVYYTTDTQLLRRTLSGIWETQEVEFYKINAFEETILGFSLNQFAQKLYWLVLSASHQVKLFSASMNKEYPGRNFTVLAVEPDIGTGTLQYLHEIQSLMWLDTGGKRATFIRLENLVENQASLELHELGVVNMGKYKLEYTPYRDNDVIPGAVEESSIVLTSGYWNDFYIKWSQVTTNENFTVYYKILLKYKQPSNMYDNIKAMEVKEPQIHLVNLPLPQLILHTTITACTWWQCGPSIDVKIRTPAAEQAEPKRLRVYLEQLQIPLESTMNLSAIVRWDPPENISKNAVATYKVFCWLGEKLFAERLTNYSREKPLEAIIGKLQTGETYTFQVQAFAPGSFGTSEKSVNFSLHVNPDVQSIPKIIYTTSEYIGELDMDLKEERKLVHTTNSVEHLAYIRSEHRLLWVNENVELISCILGSTPIKLARMRAEVISLTVDWIARIVYWAEVESDTNAVGIYKLDLCQFEGRVMTGTKILSTPPLRSLRDLLVLPFSQTLLWLEFEKGMRNASLNGRNITDLQTPLKFKEMTYIQMFEGTLTADMEIVNLIAPNGNMCGFDVHRQLCTPLKMNLFKDNVWQVERDNGYIYTLKNDNIIVYNRRKQNLEFHYEITDVYRIKALNNQVYPGKKCLLPQYEHVELYENKLQPVINKTGETYVLLDMPKVNTYEDCWLNIPGLKYSLTIFNERTNYTQHISSSNPSINITQLQPFEQYGVQLNVVSYYQQKLDLSPIQTGIFLVNTTEGVPTAPQNFSVVALSPTEIDVSWLPPAYQPCTKISYQLYWQLQNASTGAHLKTEETNITLNNLRAGAEYSIVLKAYCTPKKFNRTESMLVWTYSQLEDLHLMERQAHNLTISWVYAENLTRAVLVCRALNTDEEQEFSIDITDSEGTNLTVCGLLPKTRYEFYLELQYADVPRSYQWPQRFNEHFVFETLGTAPSAPGQPQIDLIAGEIFKVFWLAAAHNGAPIVEYSLEALQARKSKRRRRNTNLNSVEQMLKNNRTIITMLSELPWADELEPIEDKWMVYCNTSELSCIVRDLHTLRLLMFRVRARNEPYGWGPYSEDSEHVQEPFLSSGKRDSLVLAILAPAAIVSSCVIMLVIIRMVKTRRLRAKKLLEKSRPSVWSNLSSLQQHQIMMSRHRAVSVASHSTLYNGGPLSDADIALLPHISWNQITLLNFLGSGAFGEVYEGLVKYDDDDEPERVAIKSLRKGASEFSELLQEAQLMSNFRHENIVRLVGVCCDTESISIIMEHMEGGDLLNYLRESRPNTIPCTISLGLRDLVLMCLDVARGCAYLEEMHFVHRDLACRNCLVSSKDASKRQVKIGDFGLARDIYKSDYYRKEGEGLLPVRWMSPESLVDGIFTTQSDVWAFAVLCWEILSYGQQPYAARNNFEVLNYVKEGGRLDKPTSCPDKLFLLMLECWQLDPEERPSFARCVDTLLSIKKEMRQLNECDKMKAIYANETSLAANATTNGLLSEIDDMALENVNCHISLSSDNEIVKTDLTTQLYSFGQKHVDTIGTSNESRLMIFEMDELEQNMPKMSNVINYYEGVSKF